MKWTCVQRILIAFVNFKYNENYSQKCGILCDPGIVYELLTLTIYVNLDWLRRVHAILRIYTLKIKGR